MAPADEIAASESQCRLSQYACTSSASAEPDPASREYIVIETTSLDDLFSWKPNQVSSHLARRGQRT